jgi:hypothetical protein
MKSMSASGKGLFHAYTGEQSCVGLEIQWDLPAIF